MNKSNYGSMKGVIKIELIEKFMKEKHLSKQEFAYRCKISLKDLQKVCDEVSHFEPICLLKIARTIGVEFSDLVNS